MSAIRDAEAGRPSSSVHAGQPPGIDDGRHMYESVHAAADHSQDIRDLKLFYERLCERQKVESVGRLAAGLAHNFNNLLTSIIGNAGLALERQTADRSARAYLAEIIRASERAADLTRQMLAYSGKGGVIIRRVGLSDEVREIRDLLQVSLPKTVRLEFDLSDDVPLVEADASQIHQLILNLVVNGAEAIGDREGVVRIKTRTEAIGEEAIAGDSFLWELRPGIYACLEVQDTGGGMDENTLTSIFDPFYTTKFTGRGLGLAAVSGIVRRYQGAVTVNSRLCEGSTFRVFLPAATFGRAKRNAWRARLATRPPDRGDVSE